MRWLLLLCFLPFAFLSCREQRTAVSCANMSSSTNDGGKGKEADRDPRFFKHRKKVKAEDGYRRKQKRIKSHGEKAEKGEKKARKKTKAEKRIGLFRKKQRDNADVKKQNKGLFKNKEKKRKKLIKKRVKHPQEGLFPKGGPG